MPTYEYACRSCGEHLEVVQSFRDDALTECPACSGPLRKVFGNIGIAFKGSGFYKNDSRSSSNRTKAKVDGATKADAAKGDGAAKSEGAAKSDSSAKGDGAPKSDKGSKAGGSSSSGSGGGDSSPTAKPAPKAAASS